MNSLRAVATEISITLAITVVFCTAQASPQRTVPGNASARTASPAEPSKDKAAPQFGQRYPRYALRTNDVLDISFEFTPESVSYTHLRAHETRHDLVCRLLLEKKKK